MMFERPSDAFHFNLLSAAELCQRPSFSRAKLGRSEHRPILSETRHGPPGQPLDPQACFPSVLDLSFVTSGSTPTQALRNTLDLAGHADGLGYTRFWVAEHHNLPSVASGAGHHDRPDRSRDGAHPRRLGGVMLPNHAPLMVAERFKLLEALYPGRIDLGLGRARHGSGDVLPCARRRRGDATIS